MLGTCWWWVAEALEGTLDVTGNGNVDSVVVIIPINGETTIAVSGPVLADDVQFLESVDEMVGVGFVGEHDAEVVNDEAEDESGGIVFP